MARGEKHTSEKIETSLQWVEVDRLDRIWRCEGLKVSPKQNPRDRLCLNGGSCGSGRSVGTLYGVTTS